MSYQVLALKYRPQTFEDVVGQNHVTTTLTNAIVSDRVAHALLLTGPRGTGKTTIARILAKAMACEKGPDPIPCNTCKICTDITQGHCSDVFEIDGASNNSVDQIRDLRENVTYMPASARVKIYIIDEVHMLSTAAFNALLKTLEEPPEHVIFIFATTEIHKIPATILSRCQRHDLSRISLEQISGHLETLCTKEGYTLDKESLDLIAMEADGSIRDSLSLLDRVLSASPGKEISPGTVQENLGVMDRRLMADLSTAVFNQDGATLIALVERVNDAGLDLKKFYSDIIFHFRNLTIIKLCGKDNAGLNLTLSERDELSRAVETLPQDHLSLLVQLLLNEERLVKFSAHTKTAVEMVLLKLIQVSPGAHLDEIISGLDALARQVDKGIAPPSSGASTPVARETRKAAPPAPDRMSEPVPPGYQTPMPVPDTPDPQHYQAQQGQHQESKIPGHPEPSGTPAPDQGSQRLSWHDFLNKIQEKLPVIFALLSRGQVDEGGDTIKVILEVKSEFEKSRLKTKDKDLQQLAKTYLGKSIEIQTSQGQRQQEAPDSRKLEEKAKQEASMHPMVQEVRRMFDGEIIL